MRYKFSSVFILLVLTAVHAGVSYAAEADSKWQSAEQALTSASVSEADVRVIVNQARARQLTPQHLTGWAQRLGELRRNDLPTAPMIDRIQQGLAKGIPPAKIDAALDALTQNLAWGNQVVSARVARAELRTDPRLAAMAVANLDMAQRQGFTRGQLEQMLGNVPLNLGQLTTAMVLAGEWNALGMKHGEAVSTLQEAIRSGMGASELSELGRTFTQGLREGHRFDDIKAQAWETFPAMKGGFDAESMRMNEMHRDFTQPDARQHDMAPGAGAGGGGPNPGSGGDFDRGPGGPGGNFGGPGR